MSSAIQNTIWRNGLDGINIIHQGTNPLIFQNHCQVNGGSGIHVQYGAGGIIEENRCEMNMKFGIEMSGEGTSPLLKENLFLENKRGNVDYNNY